MFRRRPLMRAAVVGGTAAAVGHHYGKKSAEKQQAEADQDAQIDELQEEQAQAPAAAEAPSSEDSIAKLQQLKGLLDSGVLTQAEFDFQKQKILQTM
jgi:membrane protease subunit (stomatin/prohibitin family)